MDENDLKSQYIDIAGRLIVLAEELDKLKSIYNWMRGTGGQLQQAPAWDGGVQVLETLRFEVQQTNIATLYELAYNTE